MDFPRKIQSNFISQHNLRGSKLGYNFLRDLSTTREKEAQENYNNMKSKQIQDTIVETQNLDQELILSADLNSFVQHKDSYSHLYRHARNLIECKEYGETEEAATNYFEIKTAYQNSYPNEVKEHARKIGFTSLES